ncbi:MAG: hypothetical protein HXY19_01195 [Thermoanaerobaculaceae bacterium]|nr:hypothetical protein [Thermoanaerobaculaceae bacterium]
MASRAPSPLEALAAAVQELRPKGFRDLYLERVADTVWSLVGGAVVARHTLLREGAAVRFPGSLRSSDGATRIILAELLGVPGRRLPPLTFPPFPPAPPLEDLPAETLRAVQTVRWRWRWAALVNLRSATELFRPQLCELTFDDGFRILSTWPPPPTVGSHEPPLPKGPLPPSGRARVLLAPAAAAVLLHEGVGHLLEGDLLSTQHRPLVTLGAPLADAALTVVDDPTRCDLPGGFSADDEGIPARRRLLVAGGVVVGLLADTETASHLGVAAGSARRASVHSWPRPRISNLVLETWQTPETPLRHEADVEVESVRSGSLVAQSGHVRLAVRRAWRLRRGQRVQVLPPFLLTGSIVDALQRLRLAGPAAASGEPGWCGKGGEVVPVGAVTPWLVTEGLDVR